MGHLGLPQVIKTSTLPCTYMYVVILFIAPICALRLARVQNARALCALAPSICKVAFLLPTGFITGIRDVITNMIRSGNEQLLLSVIRCLFEAEDLSLCQFVATQLGGNLYLRITLSPLDCLSVGYFLSCVCATTSGEFRVNLENCSIDDHCCKLLTRGLSRCPSPNTTTNGQLHIHLGRNEIHEEGTHHISQVLRNSGVRQLSLNSCPGIGESGLKSIAEALITNTSLVKLNVYGCSVKITEENGPVLREMLQKNSTLEDLHLYRNPQLYDTGAAFIAEGLKQNSSLRVLDLGDCGIGDQGVRLLGDALVVTHSLKELKLRGNAITGVGGAAVLGEMLQRNSTVEVLGLSRNPQLSDAGVFFIAEGLKQNSSLRVLALGACSISDEGVRSLGDALVVNDSLKELNLQSNPVEWPTTWDRIVTFEKTVNAVRRGNGTPLIYIKF